MKKYFLLAFLLAPLSFPLSSSAYTCDVNFYDTLRVGYSYTFADRYTNNQSFLHYIAGGTVMIDETMAGDLNRGTGPGFSWTPEVANQGYEITPGQSLRVLQSSSPYLVYDYPTSRSNPLVVVYSLDVQGQKADGSWTRPPVTHNECMHYTITRCGDGVVDAGYETCDPAAPGQSAATCNPTTCTPIVQPPVCNPAKSGVQTAPVLSTDTLCTVGTASGFNAVVSGTTTNYTWSCNNSTAVNCSASYTSVPVAAKPFVSIKKYAKELNTSGDTQTTPISIEHGETFSYYYQFQNTGSVAATGVVIKDTFPAHLTFTGNIRVTNPSGTDVTSDWIVSTGSQVFASETVPRITLILTKRTPLPANSGLYTVNVPVRLSPSAPVSTSMQNVAYICAVNVDNNPTGPGGVVICGNPYPPPPPPPDQCDETIPDGQKDPACIVVGSSFDLSIKKYAKSEDVFASVENTENFNYTIVVRNNGTGAVTGTTTVRDILPAPITLRATPSGNGWTCTGAAGAADFTCTTTDTYAADTEFNVITVPVQVTDLVFRPAGYVNYAYVHNPQEADGKQCNDNGSMPNPSLGGPNGETPRTVCNEDNNNFDPATVNPPNPNGFDLRLKKFVNGDDESSAVRPGTTAVYAFTVQNLGALASSGTTTVTDRDFPAPITIASIQATQGDWTCIQLSGTGFSCTMTRSLAAGEYASTISLTANIGAAMTPGTYPNVACLSNPFDPNESAVLDPSTGKYKVNNCDPAEVVIVPANSFDLSIKKYVADITTGTPQRDGDHQTTNDGTDVDRDILTIAQGGSVRYRFVVRNEGPVTATGTTNVEDTLPNGFTITGSVVGTGWTCTQGTNGNRSFSCNRTENLAVGSSFPEIVVNAVSASAILAGEYSNTATVRNPSDTNPANNTDPANVEIVVGVPSCGTITGFNAGNVSPGTSVTYSCSALNYTGATADLQFQINCGTGTGTWSTSNTGSCVAPATSSTTMPVTCAVRDLTNSGVLFSGSLINSCRTTVTTTGTSTPSTPHYGKACVNGVPSCVTYDSIADCYNAQGAAARCHVADAAGLASCQAQSPSSCGPTPPTQCGNGVLQAGEECDVVGAEWCGQAGTANACKLQLITIPGENPITDMYIKIPQLSGTRIGASSVTNKKLLSENGVVVGKGTKVFTLGDELTFGLKTQYQIPLQIEVDKKFCLTGTGGIDPNPLCTRFGKEVDSKYIWHQPKPDGTRGTGYVLFGAGEFLVQTGAHLNTNPAYDCDPAISPYHQYRLCRMNNDKKLAEVKLFRGYEQYTPYNNTNLGPTLNSNFVGNSSGRIMLFSCPTNVAADATNCRYDAQVNWSSFGVRVSSAIVGTTGTPVNRSIEVFINTTPASIVASFLGGISNSTTTSATTNSLSNLGNITVNVATVRNVSASRVDLIPALNGNQNIRAIIGNLVIENCTNGTFVMDGVRTVIVEGDITFKCNTMYANANSSWAWIAKGGDIIISNGDGSVTDKGITNLAGVYVTIPTNGNGGRFTPRDNRATTAILKIDGSLYGNATPLFDSRLYARGTSAYDILTTGTIISYSNRALVNPPPLLSQYLNNYSVERVVK